MSDESHTPTLKMVGRKYWIGGNWKCCGTQQSITDLCVNLNEKVEPSEISEFVIFPAAIHIPHTKHLISPHIALGCQSISKYGSGAYTGEISIEMLTDFGINWVLIGHSERRCVMSEPDESVTQQVVVAQKNPDIYATICIGETLEVRESGKTSEFCKRQLELFLLKVTDWSRIVIAYEPIWAIGTGKFATPEQAQDAHKNIRDVIRHHAGESIANALRIVYGGSVTDANCLDIMRQSDIDGVLVGGASVKPTFVDIMNAPKYIK